MPDDHINLNSPELALVSSLSDEAKKAKLEKERIQKEIEQEAARKKRKEEELQKQNEEVSSLEGKVSTDIPYFSKEKSDAIEDYFNNEGNTKCPLRLKENGFERLPNNSGFIARCEEGDIEFRQEDNMLIIRATNMDPANIEGMAEAVATSAKMALQSPGGGPLPTINIQGNPSNPDVEEAYKKAFEKQGLGVNVVDKNIKEEAASNTNNKTEEKQENTSYKTPRPEPYRTSQS